MIAVTFALPQESKDFVRALERSSREATPGVIAGSLAGVEVVVAHTGVGAASATERMRELFARNRPSMLISAGFAGGLHPSLHVGDLLVASNFSSPVLLSSLEQLIGETVTAASSDLKRRLIVFAPLTTHPCVVESVAGKSQMASATGAFAVDMETAVIAEACAAAAVPMLALRVISDAAGDALPVPMEQWFDLVRQRPRPLALLAYLARHPGQIAPFARFVSGLAPARRNLTRQLLEIVRSRLP